MRQQQSPPPAVNEPNGGWHPEQAQTAFHREAWAAIRDRPYIFGSFVWVAFDLASDHRNEGDRAGINDKGLVSYDRAVRKDAYFFYQANWSSRPMIHILDRRLSERTEELADVEVASNAASVRLRLNGRLVGRRATVMGIARFAAVRLDPGENRFEADAVLSGAHVRDDVVWMLEPRSVFGLRPQPEDASKAH